jgi:Zn-dependent protease with chaperone function
MNQRLLQLLDDDELVALLHHEVAHVYLRHHWRGVVKMMTSSVLVLITVSLIMYAMSEIAPGFRSWLTVGALGVGVALPRFLYGLRTTRRFEHEADAYAAKAATPAALLSALGKVRVLQPHGDLPHSWTTHGTWNDRRARIIGEDR